jgi:hypothetical protein
MVRSSKTPTARGRGKGRVRSVAVVRRAFLGAALVVAGIAGFIEAGSHAPGVECLREVTEPGDHTCLQSQATGMTRTAYDLLRIGAWALVIFGALLIVVGLIAYRAEQAQR